MEVEAPESWGGRKKKLENCFSLSDFFSGPPPPPRLRAAIIHQPAGGQEISNIAGDFRAWLGDTIEDPGS